MDRVDLAEWTVFYDRKATRAFYKEHQLITDDCDCAYCRNYSEALGELPKKLLDLLDRLGIDPRKEAEVYECMKHDDGRHLYGTSYHFVGTLILDEAYQDSLDDGYRRDGQYILFEDYSIRFNDDVVLVPDGFPSPVLQLEFQVTIPWKLK